MLRLFQFLVLGLRVALLTAAGGEKDMNVCAALEQSSRLSNKEVSITGELRGGFYHGFAIFGGVGVQPCTQPMFNWLLTRVAVGAIPLDYSSAEPTVIAELEIMEQKQKAGGVPVRVTGILRAKWFFFGICTNKDDCFGNGYFHRYPAILELHSVQVFRERKAAR